MSAPGPTIAAAGPDDLEPVARLFDRYRVFYREKADLAGARAFIAERLAKRDSVIFLARNASGAAIGFAQLYPSFSSVSMRPIWILNDLYVEESVRRGGAGRALMERARDHARATGAKRLELTTERVNAAAQALYARCGYARDDVFFRYTLTLD